VIRTLPLLCLDLEDDELVVSGGGAGVTAFVLTFRD